LRRGRDSMYGRGEFARSEPEVNNLLQRVRNLSRMERRDDP
jgi:hypothetical protein